MPTCKILCLSDNVSILMPTFRNGNTPEQITNQILAIAPIVPGQKLSHESKQPTSAPANQPQRNAPPPAPARAPAPAPFHGGGGNDLIDFGGGPTAPAPGQHVIQQPVGGYRGLMDDDHHFNHANASKGGLLNALSPDGSYPIRRTDTHTNEVDEFVDAAEK